MAGAAADEPINSRLVNMVLEYTICNMKQIVLWAAFPLCLIGQAPSETNVIFGMHSGLALLMDVYKPPQSNGYGIVVVPGSGWHAELGYGTLPLKSSKEFVPHVKRLVDGGYTAFVITHRAAPRFRHPAAVEDAQRAVRYVRHHAARYGIRADRIGALGGSSGGHLVNMLGTLGGEGTPDDSDVVQRASAKVQCVVAFYAPSDMAKINTPFGSVTVTAMLGMRTPRNTKVDTPDVVLYREASPVTHVSGDDPPFLLIHGDNDQIVPFAQSEIMKAALEKAGVAVKLIRVPGGGHGPDFPGSKEKQDWPSESHGWFNMHLKAR
jgi:acetyl esterase/lipase